MANPIEDPWDPTMVPFMSFAQVGTDADGVPETHRVPSLPDLPEPSMPSKTDPDTSHAATETHPDPSGVSIHVIRHPSPPSAAVTLARASSDVPAKATAEQVS